MPNAQVIEDTLSVLEGDYSTAFRDIQQTIADRKPFSLKQKQILSHFIAVQYRRTPEHRRLLMEASEKSVTKLWEKTHTDHPPIHHHRRGLTGAGPSFEASARSLTASAAIDDPPRKVRYELTGQPHRGRQEASRCTRQMTTPLQGDPGMRRLITPWEYRHLDAVTSVRFAAGGFHLGVGLVLLFLGRRAETGLRAAQMLRVGSVVPGVCGVAVLGRLSGHGCRPLCTPPNLSSALLASPASKTKSRLNTCGLRCRHIGGVQRSVVSRGRRTLRP